MRTKEGQMKIGMLFFALAFALALYGCESAGFAPESAPDLVTPGVDARTTVRHWDADGKPVEKRVPNEPAFQ